VDVNTRFAALLGLLTALSGGIVGCSRDENASISDSLPVPVVQLALTPSNLPPCVKLIDGAIWYVWSTNQFYVCKGSTNTWTQTNINGYNAAVSIVPLSAGTACPAGGVTINFGLDTNRNGALDSGEITSTANLCSGATGPQGPTGPAGPAGPQGPVGPTGANGATGAAVPAGTPGPQLQITPEPPGANCSAGGERIDVGEAGDGGLTVQQTAYICNGLPAVGPDLDGGVDLGILGGGLDAAGPVSYRGGPVFEQIEVVPIEYSGGPETALLPGILSAVFSSDYLAWLGEYAVMTDAGMHTPTGTFLSTIFPAGSLPFVMAPSDVRGLMAQLVEEGLLPHNANTYYVLFVGSTTSVSIPGFCQDFSYYRDEFTVPGIGVLPFAAVGNCSSGFAGLDLQDVLSLGTSAAILGAITNPFPRDAPAWTDAGGHDIAEICAAASPSLVDGVKLTRGWSNTSSACR
jgi:hypothetical protein